MATSTDLGSGGCGAGKLELSPASSWSEVMTALYDKHRALLPPDASAVQLAFQVRHPRCTPCQRFIAEALLRRT